MLRRLRGSHIALLVALDDHGSLRKAAQHVSLSQPATTKSLHEIEAMLGVALFTRSPRGIAANEMGRCVIRHARMLRGELDALRDELSAIARGGGGSLAIGAVMESLPIWLTPTLRTLRRVHPEISVEVWEDNSAQLLSMLDQRALDLVIGRPDGSMHPEAYDFVPLAVEELCLVVDAEDPLARDPELRFGDIAGNPWIVPQASLPVRSLLEQLFEDEGMPFPQYAVETSSTFATLSLLRMEKGTIGFLPLKVAQYFSKVGLLSILSIKVERRGAPYGIATRRGVVRTHAVQQFIDLCVSQKLG